MIVAIKRNNMTIRHLFQHTNSFIFLLVLLVLVTNSVAYLDNLNKPCKYLDSINITDGVYNDDDGSIMHEGVYYPSYLHATYDYEFVNESFRQPVAPHVRGCACKLGPCVRLCCPRGQYLYRTECFVNDSVSDLSVSVTDDGVNFEEERVFDIFRYVLGKPCHEINPMEPTKYKDTDTWVLFRNGSILMGSPPIELLSKNKYCLNPIQNNDSIEISLMTCFIPASITKDSWLPYGMFISVPFLIVTILVYTILPELRNVHGKSLVCYLLGLIVGYVTLGWIKLNGSEYVEPVLCRSLGYIVYFAFISAFFWLSVISFDLWWNFRHFVALVTSGMHGISKFADFKKFLVYSAYAWGSTIFMVALCYLIDASSSISSAYQPGMGAETCFLKKSRLSEFLYLYLPIILIMTSNSTFFILTALKIRKVQIEMSRVTAKEDSRRHQKHLDNEKAKFGLFFRLFIVMGVTWTMEAISWIISPGGWYFYVTDLTNAVQGVVIFFLFVMKPKVKELIIKRWNIWRGISSPRKHGTISTSGTTRTSNIAMNSIKTNQNEVALISDVRD
ncbi:G-protein coupled receptor Mth2 [Pseudolycoriella hygida]|uniref:G-protein coupled receptor Mth2 n=1 Tax=Pseudolycoriella hygida TaxID=35572 RepID=A0A9Q0S3I9_9DIPT|nr:G-protein coupled receptor Mth2 [Pseudolycoriella hygida]